MSEEVATYHVRTFSMYYNDRSNYNCTLYIHCMYVASM